MTLTYHYIEGSTDLLQAIDELEKEAELWIDTETADWMTSDVRVSLVQARNREGKIWVLDMLEHEDILRDHFIPRIMSSPSCKKFAHNASYERRFLGGERVSGLECTLQLARSIPYHRLSLSKLTLAALVEHFFERKLDKTHQTADWKRRPLTRGMLEYAAADTEWCFHVHQALLGNVQAFEPEDEEPHEIKAEFLDVVNERNVINKRMQAIMASVKDLMLAHRLEHFSGFRLETPAVRFDELPRVIAMLDALNLETEGAVMFSLPMTLRKQLSAETAATLESLATVTSSTVFRCPSAKALPPVTYTATLQAESEITDEYSRLHNESLRLSSTRDELKRRMQGWMAANQVEEWQGFRYAKGGDRYSIEARVLASQQLPAEIAIGLPPRIQPFISNASLNLTLTDLGRIIRWAPSQETTDYEASREWLNKSESGDD